MVNKERQAGEPNRSKQELIPNPCELTLNMELAMPAIEALAKRLHSIVKSESNSWSNATEWDLLEEDDKEFFRAISEHIAMEEDLCNKARIEVYATSSPATT